MTDFVLVEARRELSSETRVTSSATTPTASSSSTTAAAAGGGGGGGSEPGGASCVRGTAEGSGHGAPGAAPGPGDRHRAEISRHQAHAGPALPAHRQVRDSDSEVKLTVTITFSGTQPGATGMLVLQQHQVIIHSSHYQLLTRKWVLSHCHSRFCLSLCLSVGKIRT